MSMDLSAWRRSRPLRYVTRAWRRTPRGLVYGIVLVACCAIAEQAHGKLFEVAAWSFDAVRISLANRDALGTVSFVVIALGSVTAALTVLLGGAYGAAGLKFVTSPHRSSRRDMKRTFRLLIASAAASLVLGICTSAVEAYTLQNILQSNADGRAIQDVVTLPRSTLVRLREQERAGQWWSDPDDTTAVHEIKTALKRGTSSDRRLLQRMIDSRIARP